MFCRRSPTAIRERAGSFLITKPKSKPISKKPVFSPGSHIVTLKKEFVDRHPGAPVALLKAFRRSRDEAFNRLEGPDPQVIVYSWMGAAINEQRELMGENY